MSPEGSTSSPDHRLPARLQSPRMPATPSLRPLLRGGGKSPRLGGPICAEPLDDESPGDSRQREFKPLVTIPGASAPRLKPATRGASLSRAARKPQIESVKKYMGSESFESSDDPFARWQLRLLRGKRVPAASAAAREPPGQPPALVTWPLCGPRQRSRRDNRHRPSSPHRGRTPWDRCFRSGTIRWARAPRRPGQGRTGWQAD